MEEPQDTGRSARSRTTSRPDSGSSPRVGARRFARRGGPAVIGIDVGTSAVKALLADADGAIRSVRRGYPMDVASGGRVEVDADGVWRAARSAIRALVAEADVHDVGIAAICCGGSGDEAVWLDDGGRPVAPVPMALDRRSDPDGSALAEAVGVRRFITATGLPPSGAYPLARLRWLRRTAPRAAARVRRLLAWPEFVAARLGVDPVAEPTLAARTAGFDVTAGAWDAVLVAASGADAGVLPPLGPTGSIVGTVRPDTARSLGLGHGVAVVAGGFDQAMATRGAGITRPGIAHLGAGSWEALTALTPEPPFGLVARGASIGPAIDADRLWSVMTSAPGATLMAWAGGLGRLVGSGEGTGDAVRRALAAARRSPDRPTDLVVLPDLAGSSGAIAGLRLDVDAGRLARGLLEGVAFGIADELDALRATGAAVDEIRITGGGTNDRRWIQLRSDVLGMPVVAVDPPDAGVAAAAALAWAAGVGDRSVQSTLATLVRLGPTVEPRRDHHERYADLRRRRSALVAALARGSSTSTIGR